MTEADRSVLATACEYLADPRPDAPPRPIIAGLVTMIARRHRLLKAYIEHVGVEEGTTFLDSHNRATVQFSDEEWALLTEFDEEIRAANRAKTDAMRASLGLSPS